VRETAPRHHISESQPAHVRDELTRNLLGQSDHSLLAWLREGSRAATQYRMIGRMILDDDTADMPVKPGSLPGDPERLRGIPAIGGRGSVGGAIVGSRPGDSLAGRRGEEILRGIRPRARATPTKEAPTTDPELEAALS
jgi:hypothetical protein